MRAKTTDPDTKPICTSVAGGMKMTGVGRNSFFQLIKDGEIEVVRIYGRTLPIVASLEALIQRGGTRKRAARIDERRDEPEACVSREVGHPLPDAGAADRGRKRRPVRAR